MEAAAARSVRWPALDGLRAVAVIAVICRHLLLLRDGYLGVDVFFTLSGFLITWLLAAEHDGTGTVSLRFFWARRALRILPALAVAVVGALVLALLIAGTGPPGAREAHATVAGLPWVAGFAANWAEASGRAIGMFGQTWSLSVEEQFYLVWPLLLVVVLPRVPRRRLAAGLGVLAACSVGWAALLTWSGASADRVYFATDTRGGGLLAGCALALWLSRGPLREARLLRRAAWPAAVGLGVLFAAASLIPGPAAVATATAASVVLVAAVVTGSLPHRLERLLCSRAALATGRRFRSASRPGPSRPAAPTARPVRCGPLACPDESAADAVGSAVGRRYSDLARQRLRLCRGRGSGACRCRRNCRRLRGPGSQAGEWPSA